MQLPGIGGLYVAGVEAAGAALAQLECTGLEVLDTVLPGAIYGRLHGGRRPDLAAVVQEAGVADPDAAVRAVGHLLDGGRFRPA